MLRKNAVLTKDFSYMQQIALRNSLEKYVEQIALRIFQKKYVEQYAARRAKSFTIYVT